MTDPSLILTPADTRRAGYCVDGVRKWFHAQGLDFRAFCRGQLTAGEIHAAVGDDALLLRVIEVAEARRAGVS